MAQEKFVGVDVAKAQLWSRSRRAAARGRWRITEEAVAELVRTLQAEPPLVVMEATGGLELPLCGGNAVGRHSRRDREPTPGARLCASHRKVEQE